MKTIVYFICLYLFFVFPLKAQQIQCRDWSHRDPIPNLCISDRHQHQVYTNALGIAQINELNPEDSITLKGLGYDESRMAFPKRDTTVSLQFKTVQLEEIVMSAHRIPEPWSDVPYKLECIKQHSIEFTNTPTTAELLQNSGAVFVQKSQLGGGSPVIRGFEANKLLIVLDGIRMNNAIYRSGHLQDIISLDANMLERVEVLFGPSSTLYGSDALGGVMHLFTKKPVFSTASKHRISGNAFMRYASVNSENTAHADVSVGGLRWATITNLTYSKFGDLMSGTNLLPEMPSSWDCNYYSERIQNRDTLLINPTAQLMKRSGYSQIDFMQRTQFKFGKTLHDFNFQYSESSNINRYDRLSEITTATAQVYNPTTQQLETVNRLKFSEWYYGPQKRLLAAYTGQLDALWRACDHMRWIVSYQKIDQDRISRLFQNSVRTTQMEDVHVYALNLDLNKLLYGHHELRYGLEITANQVNSKAQQLNISNFQTLAAKTRYGDLGNNLFTEGIYLSHAWEISPQFIFNEGLRFTANQLSSQFGDTAFYRSPYKTVSLQNQALSGNIGLTWTSENKYKCALLFSTGFRSPNIDDMSKLFESSNNVLIVPNPNLQPERVSNLECNLSKRIGHVFRFDASAYYTKLYQVLVMAPYTINGSDSLYYNGSNKSLQALQNRDRGYIYGVSLGFQYQINTSFSMFGQYHYTYGRYTNTQTNTLLPLDHIPPVFGQWGLRFQHIRTEAEGFVRFNGAKESADYSLSGEDNAFYSANPKDGYTPAWFTLNLRFGYNFSEGFRLNASCENINDYRYRVFASGINAPGRNFIVSLRYKF